MFQSKRLTGKGGIFSPWEVLMWICTGSVVCFVDSNLRRLISVWTSQTSQHQRMYWILLLVCVSVARWTAKTTALRRITSQSLTSTSPSRLQWTKPSSLWSWRVVSRADRDECCWDPTTLWASPASSHKVWLLRTKVLLTTVYRRKVETTTWFTKWNSQQVYLFMATKSMVTSFVKWSDCLCLCNKLRFSFCWQL